MAGRKDWDPRGWPHRFQVLERLASDIIGDGKSPNLFFVTVEGKVVLVTQVFQIARDAWEALSASTTTETSVEDRTVGVLAAVEPDEEEGGRLVRFENFDLLLDKDRQLAVSEYTELVFCDKRAEPPKNRKKQASRNELESPRSSEPFSRRIDSIKRAVRLQNRCWQAEESTDKSEP